MSVCVRMCESVHAHMCACVCVHVCVSVFIYRERYMGWFMLVCLLLLDVFDYWGS